MRSSHTNRELSLYLLAFLLALAIRLFKLGAQPLTDSEANWALQALNIAQGIKPALGSHVAYLLLTSLLFFVFAHGTNFLARLVPALVGSALVFAPALFRERLKPRPALILAFFLAFDPGLVALSRQAGSAILVVAFLPFAWGFWEQKQPRWAGVFAALALLSGPALWAGLLGLGLTWAIRQGVEARGGTETVAAPARVRREDLLAALWPGLGTLVLGGTLFFLSPAGLSAWFDSLPEYLRGWGLPSGVPAGRMLFSLAAYQPLAVILGLTAAVRGWWQGGRFMIRLSLWALVALLLAIFYPARQVSDLVWMLIPLWALAALELARDLDVLPEERVEVAGVILLSIIILAFAWLDLAGLIWTPLPSEQGSLRTWLLFGSLFLLILSILLVAVGWSVRLARFGAVWGLTAALGIYSFSATWSAAGLRTPAGAEMWAAGRTPMQADLLLATADQLSEWSTGHVDSQPVTIAGVNSPALLWLLRDYKVDVVDVLEASASPPLVITPHVDNPTLAAAYRGQDFVWREEPLWDNALPGDWLRWIVLHQMPQTQETIILWARSDLFLHSGPTAP